MTPMHTQIDSKWSEGLQEKLKEELHTMWEVIGMMEVKNEAEFIATALPNLHLGVFDLLSTAYHQGRESAVERVVEDCCPACKSMLKSIHAK